MTDETQNKTATPIIAAMLLSSGVVGGGTNFVMNDYKIEQVHIEIQQIKEENKDLRANIRALMQGQNECMNNAKILEYRLKNQEKFK